MPACYIGQDSHSAAFKLVWDEDEDANQVMLLQGVVHSYRYISSDVAIACIAVTAHFSIEQPSAKGLHGCGIFMWLTFAAASSLDYSFRCRALLPVAHKSKTSQVTKIWMLRMPACALHRVKDLKISTMKNQVGITSVVAATQQFLVRACACTKVLSTCKLDQTCNGFVVSARWFTPA